MSTIDIKPWLRPAAYIATATAACFLFTAFVPPLLDPAVLGGIPVLGSLPPAEGAYWGRFTLAFLLLGLLPLAVALLLGARPRDLGLTLRVPLLGRWWFWLLIPAALLIGAVGGASPDLGAFYPYAPGLAARVGAAGLGPLLGHLGAYLVLYYLPWEFFFRGFLLLGLLSLADRAGRAGPGPEGVVAGTAAPADPRADLLVIIVVLFQTLPSTFLHVGHPLSEQWSAIPAGLAFGILAWRTRSIVPSLLLHVAIGVGTDTFIVLKGAGLL